ncbi:methyltransferase [Lentzea sp. NPDC005914]|uniref:methyltransferase n=1 Tax=Lentzea sp. NPDC005914 TaxID=3154572 RepID=UPI003402CB4D
MTDHQTIVFETMDPLFKHMLSSYLLRTTLVLGLPDLIGDEPADVTELARTAGLDPDLTARLFRALQGLGFFHQTGPDTYAHNDLSRLLRTNTGDASAEVVSGFLKPEWMWPLWEKFTDAVRTGISPFSSVHGKDFYSFLGEAPAVAENFNRAMTLSMAPISPLVAQALDLGAGDHLVDVGGGQGAQLRAVLEHHPGARGTLFDLDVALTDADPELRTGVLAERCEIVAGDARESVPAADAYLMRMVMHNWDDDTCVQILSRCAEAGNEGARVFVVEALRSDDYAFVPLMDLQMFMLVGGKERDEDEFAALFERAGLRYVGTRETPSAFHVIEARR